MDMSCEAVSLLKWLGGSENSSLRGKNRSTGKKYSSVQKCHNHKQNIVSGVTDESRGKNTIPCSSSGITNQEVRASQNCITEIRDDTLTNDKRGRDISDSCTDSSKIVGAPIASEMKEMCHIPSCSDSSVDDEYDANFVVKDPVKVESSKRLKVCISRISLPDRLESPPIMNHMSKSERSHCELSDDSAHRSDISASTSTHSVNNADAVLSSRNITSTEFGAQSTSTDCNTGACDVDYVSGDEFTDETKSIAKSRRSHRNRKIVITKDSSDSDFTPRSGKAKRRKTSIRSKDANKSGNDSNLLYNPHETEMTTTRVKTKNKCQAVSYKRSIKSFFDKKIRDTDTTLNNTDSRRPKRKHKSHSLEVRENSSERRPAKSTTELTRKTSKVRETCMQVTLNDNVSSSGQTNVESTKTKSERCQLVSRDSPRRSARVRHRSSIAVRDSSTSSEREVHEQRSRVTAGCAKRTARRSNTGVTRNSCDVQVVSVIDAPCKPAVDAFKMMYSSRRPTASLSAGDTKARRQFLSSGIPEQLLQQCDTARRLQQSSQALFPSIGHVTQLPADAHWWTGSSVSHILQGVTARESSPAPPAPRVAAWSWNCCSDCDVAVRPAPLPAPLALDWSHVISLLQNHAGGTCSCTAQWSVRHALARPDIEQPLVDWLTEWRSPRTRCHDDSSGDEADQTASTMLLLGASGCGKTDAVHSAAQQLGYQVLEMNVACGRSGRQLTCHVTEATRSHHRHVAASCVLLFDDAHLAAPTLDDGFATAVAALAASTRRPIVLTGENEHAAAAVSARRLHVHRPSASLVLSHAAAVALLHSCWPGEPALRRLARHGDSRHALLQLQVMCGARPRPPLVDSAHFIDSLSSSCSQHHRHLLKQLLPQTITLTCDDFHTDPMTLTPEVTHSPAGHVDLLDLTRHADTMSQIQAWSSGRPTCRHYWWTVTPRLGMADVLAASQQRDIRVTAISQQLSALVCRESARALAHQADPIFSSDQSVVWQQYSNLWRALPSHALSRRACTLDVLPFLRSVCRLESTRLATQGARKQRRFLHYLDSVGLHALPRHVHTAICPWLVCCDR